MWLPTWTPPSNLSPAYTSIPVSHGVKLRVDVPVHYGTGATSKTGTRITEQQSIFQGCALLRGLAAGAIACTQGLSLSTGATSKTGMRITEQQSIFQGCAPLRGLAAAAIAHTQGLSLDAEMPRGSEQASRRSARKAPSNLAIKLPEQTNLLAWVGPTMPSAVLDCRDTPTPASHLRTAALVPALPVWGVRHLAWQDTPLPLASPSQYLAQHFAAFVQQAVAEWGAPSGAAPRFIWAVPYIVDRVAQVTCHHTCQGLAYAATSGCVDVTVALAVAWLGGILHHTVLRPSSIHLLFSAHPPRCRTARILRGLYALYKKQYIPVHSSYI
ncbi:hypothetical protein GGX14DRAFT_385753 [Mycena pura]|uniref:Uncharacterized protein n=1 Tax=Mycena pura TaxID=153505 RepID=A0AAD6YR52_9AGAR|nr:hypothetical protein GGX14DRAFT_385753 [Mycena pura]